MDFGLHDWEGGGDSSTQIFDTNTSDFNFVRMRVNGRPQVIPLYTTQDSSDFQSFHDPRNTGTKRTESFADVLGKYLACPICNDTVIEATSTNCGHKFCKACIEKWFKEKPICPLCSTLIKSLHRLYSVDQMIEAQLNSFPPQFKSRYLRAQKQREADLLRDHRSSSLLKRLKRKWTNSMTSLKCKTHNIQIGEGLVSYFRYFWGLICDILTAKNGLCLGIILGMLFLLALNFIQDNIGGSFIHYMWLAAWAFDGTIPTAWTQDPSQVPQEIPSFLEPIISIICPFCW